MSILIRYPHNNSALAKGCVATIGNFDGVHAGHSALLLQLKQRAHILNLPSLVLVFEPQPFEFFVPEPSLSRLTRFREKYYYLSKTGVDMIYVMRFASQLAGLDAQAFMEKILRQSLHVKYLVLGSDFRFGYKRQGDIALLQSSGWPVDVVPDLEREGERVSSTRIRHALRDGDLVLAEKLLGHPYCMMGRVVRGNQLGRALGFPTANINVHRRVTPVQGIYAVRVHGLKHHVLLGVANVGTRPTIGGTRTLLEVHLFDFSDDIYGRSIRVEFCKKLRDEEYYPNLDLLKAQMRQDVLDARGYFNTSSVISAPLIVIPAPLIVIPAKAGTHPAKISNSEKLAERKLD